MTAHSARMAVVLAAVALMAPASIGSMNDGGEGLPRSPERKRALKEEREAMAATMRAKAESKRQRKAAIRGRLP